MSAVREDKERYFLLSMLKKTFFLGKMCFRSDENKSINIIYLPVIRSSIHYVVRTKRDDRLIQRKRREREREYKRRREVDFILLICK